MHVSRLELRDFRNYAHAELELGPGPHLLVGRNGQGKTNLVEAIGYLATLSSHRVSSDAALVRRGCDSAIVRASLRHGDRQLGVDVEITKSGSNTARVNGRVVRARELPRYVTTVLFAPEDLTLVRGDPGRRRGFLDALIATRSPRAGTAMADYERVLRQRNSLLRSARATGLKEAQLATLDVWDERLVGLGTEIVAERLRLAAELGPFLAAAYALLVGEDHGAGLSLRLSALAHAGSVLGDEEDDEAEGDEGGDITVAELESRFAARLAEVRPKELERGVTLVGPHRDDAVLWLNGLPARVTASHGESWSFALALRLAAAELVRADSRAGDPVLILDDVFAELDAGRRARLAEAVGHFEQVFITAAVIEDVPVALRGHAIGIRAGEIVPDAELDAATGAGAGAGAAPADAAPAGPGQGASESEEARAAEGRDVASGAEPDESSAATGAA